MIAAAAEQAVAADEAGASDGASPLNCVVGPEARASDGDKWMSDAESKESSSAYSLAPMLSVRNGARAVEFYKAAFGATEVFRIEDPGGAVVSRLSVAGAEFWVSDESPEHANFSPESLGGGTVRMVLTVPDPDAMFSKAVAAGALEVVAVAEAYGWRLGRVVDPY